jgi:hypothetical protein
VVREGPARDRSLVRAFEAGRRDARRGTVLLAGDCDGIALRHHLGVPTLRITQDAAADELLGRDPLALLLGMMLDRQFPR